MGELAEKLANNTLQGQVEYQDFSPLNDAAIDETWKYIFPIATLGKKPMFNFIGKGLGNLLHRELRNVNDGVKRTFYTREQAEDYYNNLLSEYGQDNYKRNDLIDFEILSQKGKQLLRKQWKQFAKDNFIGKDINIPEYPTARFSSNNIGKEYLHNLPRYEGLSNNLPNSQYRFSTNFKKESDRLYDHLIDNNSDGLFDYLMEVIKDKDGNISHTYKMMKNITRGDKP